MSSAASPVLTIAPCSPFPHPFCLLLGFYFYILLFCIGLCVFLCSSFLSVCLSKAGHTGSFTVVWILSPAPDTSCRGKGCPLPLLPPFHPRAHESHCFLQVSANLPVPITCSLHLQLLFTHNTFTPVLIPQQHSSFLSFLRRMLPSLACQCLWHHIPNPAQSFLFPLSFPRHFY